MGGLFVLAASCGGVLHPPGLPSREAPRAVSISRVVNRMTQKRPPKGGLCIKDISFNYCCAAPIEISSISKISASFGPILGGEPYSP